MFGYSKTLRRIKADYAQLNLNAIKTVPCYTNRERIETRRTLRPLLRYGACTAAAVVILLAGTFTTLPRLGVANPAASSGKTAVSHNFELTAYAVNSSTHKKTKLNFNLNYHEGQPAYTVSITGSSPTSVSLTAASVSNTLVFTNCLSKNMSSVTYECVNGIFSTNENLPVSSKIVTLQQGSKSSMISWIGPPNIKDGACDTINVTARFTDGASAKKQVAISFNKNHDLIVKLKNA